MVVYCHSSDQAEPVLFTVGNKLQQPVLFEKLLLHSVKNKSSTVYDNDATHWFHFSA